MHTDADGVLELGSADLDLLTRGILRTPEPEVDKPPQGESFEWVVRPNPRAVQVDAFVDGSRLAGEHDLFGMCARQGWAFAAYDVDQQLVAAAKGRTPDWAEGIHATELWALNMALQSLDPGCVIKGDCQAVHRGSQRGIRWAGEAGRTLARAWGPVAAALGDAPERALWMPAHCTDKSMIGKTMSDGRLVTKHDVEANALVDGLAKQVARRHEVPEYQARMVRAAGKKVEEAAIWIGRATAYAARCPAHLVGAVPDDGRCRYVRDTEAVRSRRYAKRAARQCPPAGAGPGEARDAGRTVAAGGGGAAGHPRRAELKAKAEELRREARRAEERATQHIIDSRPPPAPRQGPSAVDRIEALRQRIAARASGETGGGPQGSG